MNDEQLLLQEHLRQHLTDGYWHDSCAYCQNRRRYGGNGTKTPARDAAPERARDPRPGLSPAPEQARPDGGA